MTNQVVSLAWYVFRAKKTGVPREKLTEADYQDILPTVVDIVTAASIWQDSHEEAEALLPLPAIDLTQTDYLDVVAQIYAGVPYGEIKLKPVLPKPPAILHTPYLPQYLASIPDDVRTPTAVKATLERLDEVLADRTFSASPHGNGLVVGRVQSGKTRNYIGLMLDAADNGWNVIIVLTSAIRALAQQTRDRIAEEFANVGATNKQFSHELDFLSSNGTNSIAGAELDGDFLYWGVAMKETNSLNRIRTWLSAEMRPIKKMRVMIIDDEADNATPDANTSVKGNLSEEEIDERIDAIRATHGFEPLADWFLSLRERKWPDIGEKTPAAQAFGEVVDLLRGALSKKKLRDTIVNTAAYRKMLGMEEFADPPVSCLVPQHFHKALGEGDDSCGAFVLLLKSILDIVRERSAINAAVCVLVGPDSETGSYAYAFAKCAYIAYTATPYANILNEGPSHTPIYADFIQSLEIVPQYFGVEAIYGHDIASIAPRMSIVCPITEDEEQKILTPLRQDGTLDWDDNLVCTYKDEKIEWKSLKAAVAWAFCAAAARRHARLALSDEKKRTKRENRWTTMIVNVHHVQAVHGITKRILSGFIASCCREPEARITFAEACRAVWDEQTKQFTKTQFDALFNQSHEPSENYGEISDYPKFEDIASDLAHFLDGWQQYVHAIVINSTPVGKEEQALYSQDAGAMELTDDHLWLVSGGNTIGRGLTLPGLVVSYFDRVRDGTCVDTLTQMGRWFGYRPGYELLPRIWMNLDTIGEMKRIAMLELRMHESIADNFAQKFSPSDPAHYQQIYCWGRGLSGRARSRRALDADIGTIGSLDDYFSSEEKRQQALTVSEAFISGLGSQTAREDGNTAGKFPYATTPLWENVSRTTILDFLKKLLPFYPDRSRRLLRGLLRDIAGSESVNWDVVIGNPRHPSEKWNLAGHEVGVGTPTGPPSGSEIVRTSTARLHVSFYAMIRAEVINRMDIATLKKFQGPIAAILENKCAKVGSLPPHYDAALPHVKEGDSIADRLAALVAELEAQDGDKPLPEPIHARFDDVIDPGTNASLRGFRNRSSGEYMAAIHKSAHQERPTLQLYLVRPKNVTCADTPCVNVSFFWPGHAPDDFFTVCVDENPDFVRLVTPRVFCQNVEDILREHDFPMQRKELLCKVLERLGLKCNANFFAQHINQPLDGFKFHKMAGRNAYCIDGWATDEEARLNQELLCAAVDLLQRERREMKTEAILDLLLFEQPRFRDFFTKADTTHLNQLLTDEILTANDITVVCKKPVTYLYHC